MVNELRVISRANMLSQACVVIKDYISMYTRAHLSLACKINMVLNRLCGQTERLIIYNNKAVNVLST